MLRGCDVCHGTMLRGCYVTVLRGWDMCEGQKLGVPRGCPNRIASVGACRVSYSSTRLCCGPPIVHSCFPPAPSPFSSAHSLFPSASSGMLPPPQTCIFPRAFPIHASCRPHTHPLRHVAALPPSLQTDRLSAIPPLMLTNLSISCLRYQACLAHSPPKCVPPSLSLSQKELLSNY
jgi:hypothetical protein